jgi:hypothetical protein
MSTIQTFINALKTGRTRTTRALDEIFAAPAALPDSQKDAFQAPGVLHPLADWMRDRLKAVSDPLIEDELRHIDEWPAAQKEQVRLAIAQAIAGDVTMRFRWELYSGVGPDTVIVDHGTDGIFVTFRSPRSSVRLEGDTAVFVGA